MKKNINSLFIAFLLITGISLQQLSAQTSPGGVATNLSFWLKANDGTNAINNGDNVTLWEDQSGGNRDFSDPLVATFVPYLFKENAINFNPAIDNPDAARRSLRHASAADIERLYFVISSYDGAHSCRGVFGEWGADDENVRICNSTNWSFPGNADDFTHGPGTPEMRRNGLSGTSNSSIGFHLLSVKAPSVKSFTGGLEIGNLDYLLDRVFYGQIAEIIGYSADNALARNAIESYLAIKYGITLNQTTAQNYVASDGTALWNATTATTYTFDIAGIGRDDTSALNQKQSKSVNANGIVAMGLSTIEATNATNTATFANDRNFMVWANNNGAATWTTTGAPTNFQLLSKQWQVQETGTVGAVTVQFNVADTDFNVPALAQGAVYYIVYDTNNNNDLSDESPIVLTNSASGQWQTSSPINFTTGTEFTLATLNVPDSDGDGVPDTADICPGGNDYLDADGDTVPDFCDSDDDNDGILDVIECSSDFLRGQTMQDLFSIAGDATFIDPKELQLTPAQNYTSSTVNSNFLADLSNDFLIRIDVNLGVNDAGADGIAFIMHNDPAGILAQGFTGIGLGAWGIQYGLAFELDTYRNTGLMNDPVEDHFSVFDTDTGVPELNYNSAPDLVFNPVLLGNIEDGVWRELLIDWNASTQTLSMSLEGNILGSLSGNLANDYFNGSNQVRLAFSASTGLYNNDQRVRFLATCDYDMDGIPNALDLDSDNDGCPDAIEGDGTYVLSDLTNNTITAIDPNTGLASNGIQGIGFAKDVSVVVCCDASDSGYPDADGDDVTDSCDLDDDNDGILDTVEGAFCADRSGNAYLATILAYHTDATVNADPNVILGSGTVPYSIGSPSPLNFVNASFGTNVYVANSGNTDADFRGQEAGDAESYAVFFRPTTTTRTALLNAGYTPNPLDEAYFFGAILAGGSWNILDLDAVFTGFAAYELLFDAVRLEPVPGGNAVGPYTGPDISGIEALTVCSALNTDGDNREDYLDLDSDNDGIYDVIEAGGTDLNTDGRADDAVDANGVPASANGGLTPIETTSGTPDYLNLDSDGDTCSDANEAYSNANIDGGDGGVYGTGIPAVNGNGLVTAANYSAPFDGNTNSVFDFREAVSSPSVSTDVAGKTIFTGTNGTFSVDTIDADLYQWEVSIDNGANFTPIADGAAYTGTQTDELTIITPSIETNGYIYRVIITNSAMICVDYVSLEGILTVSPRTIITNRRITHRVKE